jgi:hypothetical protein
VHARQLHADHERGCDLTVRIAAGDQLQDLRLAR